MRNFLISLGIIAGTIVGFIVGVLLVVLANKLIEFLGFSLSELEGAHLLILFVVGVAVSFVFALFIKKRWSLPWRIWGDSMLTAYVLIVTIPIALFALFFGWNP